LVRERGDAAGKLRFDPIQLEAIRRCYAQAPVLIIEWRQWFYPRAKFLRRLLLLQLGGAALPEIFHESF
jgi:hypothetical protein